jgi:hypothetical protein
MFLFKGCVVESAVSLDRPADGHADPVAVQVWFADATLKGRSRVEASIFDEQESVPVESVSSGFGDDIDRASCCSSRLSRKALIYNLKFANGLKR